MPRKDKKERNVYLGIPMREAKELHQTDKDKIPLFDRREEREGCG
jgi:hypothetical protein